MEILLKMDLVGLNDCVKDGKYVFFFMVGWCLDCVFIKLVMLEIECDFVDY